MSPNSQNPKLLFTIKEAVEIMSISRPTLYKEINQGRLRTFNVGRRRYVSLLALEAWIRARELEAGSELRSQGVEPRSQEADRECA